MATTTHHARNSSLPNNTHPCEAHSSTSQYQPSQHQQQAQQGPPKKSYYESQRELLVSEIAQSLEHVLQHVNALNRSLEEVVQVGAEFAPVESLWSHFEGVMGDAAVPVGGVGKGRKEEQGEEQAEHEDGIEEGDTSVIGSKAEEVEHRTER